MAWQRGGAGDQDYLAAWALVLGPVVAAFQPDLVLVSAGFDAAEGDPLGGCRLTPHGYARLTVGPPYRPPPSLPPHPHTRTPAVNIHIVALFLAARSGVVLCCKSQV